jgi:hypothetical protein
MDHEYSISGTLWVAEIEPVLAGQERREYAFGNIVLLLSTATNNEIRISLKDKSLAPSISDNEIAKLCSELSKIFSARVRMEKLHEEYGNANVFNGGSDYEVVCADRFVCECLNGKEISRVKTVF